MPLFRPFSAPLSALMLAFAWLLGACSSAPDYYTDLPIEPAPQYNRADLPKLSGVLLKLHAKTYSTKAVNVAYVANRDNTALYEFVQRDGKWSLWSIAQWSVYHRMFCLYSPQSEPACLNQLDDQSFVEEGLPKGRSSWVLRVSLVGNKKIHQKINAETGEALAPTEMILRPLGATLSSLKAVIDEAGQAEATFQEKVSFATRDENRRLRWQELREADRQSTREFNAFMTGLHGQLQEANQQADEQLARSTSNLNDTLARIREQERQQQARSQSGTTSQPGNARARSAPAPAPAPVRQASAPASRNTVEMAPDNEARQADSAGSRARAADSGPRRQAYLEAVTVCSRPSGPNLAFECATPLQRIRGHKNDISGMRSPQEYIASSEACPDPRQLPSSTHLVWGCGFAATGGVNALDRGQGVAIQGRRTYYCTEKQLSCRRTQP